MRGYLSILYGVTIIAILYFVIRMMYSVYYTPGSTVLYNSPVTQQLFPGVANKLFPTWGYNKAGMYNGQPFKFGQQEFWPKSGKGYVPNKFGSPGASPSGGMRPTFKIPSEVDVGFWGNSPQPESGANLDIYDNSSQHVEYITPVGHWDE
jgi:hypothetical protein